MAVYDDYIVKGSRVLLWQLTESVEELWAMVLSHGLEQQCKEAIAGITADKRRKERLASRLALWYLGVDKPIKYTEAGRPLLDDGRYVSISHTAGWVAVAVADVPLGVDIERRGDKAWRVARRFLHENEREMLMNRDDRESVATLLWSAKEAVFKLLDCAEVDFIRHLRIEDFQGFINRDMKIPFSFVMRELRSERQALVSVECRWATDSVLTIATYAG